MCQNNHKRESSSGEDGRLFKGSRWAHKREFVFFAQLAKILSVSLCKKKIFSKCNKQFPPIGGALPLLTLDFLIKKYNFISIFFYKDTEIIANTL